MKVTEALHTAGKLSTVARIHRVALYALVTVVSHSGRWTLGAALNVGDSLRRLDGEGAVGIVDCKGEARGMESKSER